MVNIDSFGFNEEYNVISVHAIIPNVTGVNYWDRRYIKSIIIATQNAYDTQNGDIQLGDEELRETLDNGYTAIYYKYGIQYLITNAPNVPDYHVDPDYDISQLEPYKELTASLNIDTSNIKELGY